MEPVPRARVLEHGVKAFEEFVFGPSIRISCTGRRHRSVSGTEHGMVEYIKRLCPELQLFPFGDGKVRLNAICANHFCQELFPSAITSSDRPDPPRGTYRLLMVAVWLPFPRPERVAEKAKLLQIQENRCTAN
jgi:hypothetical protein